MTSQFVQLSDQMQQMKAEKTQSDDHIEQLKHQLTDALDKHSHHLSQVVLDHSVSSSALHEKHQQSIDDLAKQMEELRLQHATDVQLLKNAHEMEMQSLKTAGETQRNELTTALAVAKQDVHATPQQLNTAITANDNELIDSQENTELPLHTENTQTQALDALSLDALSAVQEELELAKKEIIRLNELIFGRKVYVVTVTGAVDSYESLILPLSRALSCY